MFEDEARAFDVESSRFQSVAALVDKTSAKGSKCSRDDPCTTCMNLALAASLAQERKTLRWSDCIRTLLTDVSIFIHGMSPPSDNQIEEHKLTEC